MHVTVEPESLPSAIPFSFCFYPVFLYHLVLMLQKTVSRLVSLFDDQIFNS